MKAAHKYRFLSLILASVIVLYSTNFSFSAMAAPSHLAQMETSSKSDLLPPKVVKAVLSDLSERHKIPAAKLKVIKYNRESWSNGCLGLPQPEELCTQAIVEGWRVVVSDGSQKWFYRTDNSGRNVRLQ